MELDDLALKLQALSDDDLVNVLSRVLPLREPYKSEPLVKRSRMFLGIYAVDDDAGYIKAIAYPVDREIGPGWGFCQNAESNVGDVEFTSNCKRCLSPFDGEELYLT